jgi:hypothetical protein
MSIPDRCSACWATAADRWPPHLHFHIVNGPSAAASDGYPYTLSHFKLAARASIDDLSVALKGKPGFPARNRLNPRARSRQLPLGFTIDKFLAQAGSQDPTLGLSATRSLGKLGTATTLGAPRRSSASSRTARSLGRKTSALSAGSQPARSRYSLIR